MPVLDRGGENLKGLRQIQRSVLLSMTGGLTSTPTLSMEVMLGIQPISDYIKSVGVRTGCRLKANGQWVSWKGLGFSRVPTHTDKIDEICNVISETLMPCDNTFSWLEERSYTVTLLSREKW